MTSECEFVPANEPWTCRVHQGVRTSLDEPQCDIARPAEPFNNAYLDNIRQGIAEGRNPGSRYVVRRLLATIEADRAALAQPVPDSLSHIEYDEQERWLVETDGDGASRIVARDVSRLHAAAIITALAQPVPDSLTAEGAARKHYEPQRHFFEPPDGDGVCSECGEFRDADFVRVTVHYNDGDG